MNFQKFLYRGLTFGSLYENIKLDRPKKQGKADMFKLKKSNLIIYYESNWHRKPN